jgi:hypothetical protein
MNGIGNKRSNGFIGAIMDMFVANTLKVQKRHEYRNIPLGVSQKYRARFNLGNLPPRWKGKRMRRILRGGK